MDDEVFKEFINESREHLSTIESDLLAIEESGDAASPDLVNKVFRAAHSIKGGSSFFGLAKVKELAHKAETILDMVRSKNMMVNPEVTNVLLAAFDKLREMINNPGEMEGVDIADLSESLSELAVSYLPSGRKQELADTVTLPAGGKGPDVVITRLVFDRVKTAGQCIYSVEYDLIHDIERRGLNVITFFRELEESGEILDCQLDFEAAGSLDEPVGNRLPLRIVFATTVSGDMAVEILMAARDKIQMVFDAHNAPAEAKPAPAPASPVVAVAPPPAPVAAAPASAPAPEPAPMATPAEPEPAKPQPAAAKTAEAPAANKPSSVPADETLRVNVALLEAMMNLAGELVLSRNQLHSAIAQNNGQLLNVADQRINQVTSELQDAIMRTRLQPIGNVLGKFPRLVRDMSQSLGKEIQLDILGKDVALDKSMIEGLSDPLTHMIRNAVDHGVETRAERIASGKLPTGKIRIEARHEAGQVVVEIEDDGKGIDPRKVADSAMKKGLITAEKVRGMSDHDKQALIFLPGLSTAQKVSDISGRGVGMDVVKTNLDHLGGTVEIKSVVGKGSLFRIKLPLTLAIIPSLVVSAGLERFAIPQANVEELLRVPAEEVKKRVEIVGDSEVLLLRDRIIPLVRFADVVGVTPTYIDPNTGRRELDRRQRLADRRSPQHPLDSLEEEVPAKRPLPERANGRRHNPASALEIVVVTTGTLEYGLVFDSFHDTEEIVVKPLGRHLKGLREYMGATILGDGTVVLILDITGLSLKARLASVSGSARAMQKAQEADRERLADVHSFLLFHNAADEQCATPLDTVLRVERINRTQVEMAGGRRTLQYRGGSLPLVTLGDTARVKELDDTKDLAVIVSSVRGHEVGLLGAMPVDVVETKVSVDQVTHRQAGIVGSAIIREQTTLIADLYELVEAAYPDLLRPPPQTAAPMSLETLEETKAVSGGYVLLAEDSDFFRSQIKKYLEDAGHQVLAAPDGQAAWELLQKNLGQVKAVVTDIEMPRMTGLELARRIRSEPQCAKLPIIALSSLAGEDDIANGKAAGVDDYQVKLDRDRLTAGLEALWQRSETV